MNLIRYIFSKTFLIQLLIAAGVIIALVLIILLWLNKSTNHDQRIAVPDLTRMTLDLVEQELENADLRYIVLDSANYNPDYPRYSVIEQTPAGGKFVKENRKIYLVLNPSDYRKIEVPDIVTKTRRQAEPRLEALGFKIGDIVYRPHIAKDEVLEVRHAGKKVSAGDMLPKTSVIDLILGDGTRGFVPDDDGDDNGDKNRTDAGN